VETLTEDAMPYKKTPEQTQTDADAAVWVAANSPIGRGEKLYLPWVSLPVALYESLRWRVESDGITVIDVVQIGAEKMYWANQFADPDPVQINFPPVVNVRLPVSASLYFYLDHVGGLLWSGSGKLVRAGLRASVYAYCGIQIDRAVLADIQHQTVKCPSWL